MAIHPESSFPLLARDQAEVIRIYLELMRERDRSGRAPEVTMNQPLRRLNDRDRSWSPGGPTELD